MAVYKLATCIYAVTYYFANTYFPKGDRTIDQMVQAARSGKQNIAEGSVDGITSTGPVGAMQGSDLHFSGVLLVE